MNELELWQRYRRCLCVCDQLGLWLDVSRMMFAPTFLDAMADPIARAFDAMDALERGAEANADEHRMVGHYWLRAPQIAPKATIRDDIERTIAAVRDFAEKIHTGGIKPPQGDGFFVVLVVGIGGSALGPQFVSDALGSTDDPVILRFIDNTDPDGIDRILAELDESLGQTLTLVISKSGGTKETRNGMLEVAAAYQRAGLSFPRHAVAVTGEGSALHRKATDEQWLATFPMWDWVGGRTSVLSAVGLLPAALQGLDIDALLGGAHDCDVATRNRKVIENPAALLALMWHYAGNGRGERNMVILPYRDRLCLLSRYLQQLVMESLGKELDRSGAVVHQGLTVYGNKGSTDQHAYVQQLRDGANDFFATFIGTLRDHEGKSIDLEPGITSGDYLNGFLHGTRTALTEGGRESITIKLDRLDARGVGVLIALFERAVGLYAELIDVNAYHQPGVEAGKKAAARILGLQNRALDFLREGDGTPKTAEEIAEGLGLPEAVETIHHILGHAAANDDHGVTSTPGSGPFDVTYSLE